MILPYLSDQVIIVIYPRPYIIYKLHQLFCKIYILYRYFFFTHIYFFSNLMDSYQDKLNRLKFNETGPTRRSGQSHRFIAPLFIRAIFLYVDCYRKSRFHGIIALFHLIARAIYKTCRTTVFTFTYIASIC